jgi:hypothetical protein
MRPFPQGGGNHRERVFNYRLSRCAPVHILFEYLCIPNALHCSPYVCPQYIRPPSFGVLILLR